jgi:phycobilisome core component
MKEMIQDMALEAGVDDTSCIDSPFDHLAREFSDVSV